LISVYYEALCPDSKGFIVKQLMPAYQKIPNLIDIEFFPYGKATTHDLPDGKKACVPDIDNMIKALILLVGSLKFDCQHGEVECEANIIHCCAIEAIHDLETKLNVVACMIQDNSNPKEAFARCSKSQSIDVETIQKCYSSLHGKELLRLAGEATNSLRPRVSFIPTITLDGDQRRQATILRDLMGEICKVLENGGIMPKACESL
jgi:interferon, gamma-inducible protein 30